MARECMVREERMKRIMTITLLALALLGALGQAIGLQDSAPIRAEVFEDGSFRVYYNLTLTPLLIAVDSPWGEVMVTQFGAGGCLPGGLCNAE